MNAAERATARCFPIAVRARKIAPMYQALQRSVVVAVLLLAWSPPPALAGEVTIYRCVDATGKQTLRDTPCAKGEQQQTRTMPRPKDAAPSRAQSPAPASQPDYPARTRVLATYPPRPLYECTDLNDKRYTSDDGEGNPRWVPLWTLGYPAYVGARPLSGVDYRAGGQRVDVPGINRPGSGRFRPGYAGTWIRDPCHVLPHAEACARLVDQRDEIRRRFFNAMPSERDVLRVEERGLNARLDNDCGAH